MSVNYCELSKQLLASLVHVVEAVTCDDDCDFDHEGVLLVHGDHVITFKTDFRPGEVYVSITPQGGTPVCSGNLSSCSTSLLEDGFVLYAHIAEDSAVVKWMVRT
jgi:hypothetical protein